MINLIAAIDLNNALGHKNQLLTKLPSDMKHFQKLTKNNFCVFGRKTFESIGRPLPNRTNIIITRNDQYQAPEGTYVYGSLSDVIYEYESYNENENELYVCGGAEVYRQALSYSDRIYLTVINHKFSEADTYFPQFSLDEWKVTENIKNEADESNPYEHHFITYERKI